MIYNGKQNIRIHSQFLSLLFFRFKWIFFLWKIIYKMRNENIGAFSLARKRCDVFVNGWKPAAKKRNTWPKSDEQNRYWQQEYIPNENGNWQLNHSFDGSHKHTHTNIISMAIGFKAFKFYSGWMTSENSQIEHGRSSRWWCLVWEW